MLWSLIKPIIQPWLVVSVAPPIVAVLGPVFGAMVTALAGAALCVAIILVPQHLLVAYAERRRRAGTLKSRKQAAEQGEAVVPGLLPGVRLVDASDSRPSEPPMRVATGNGAGFVIWPRGKSRDWVLRPALLVAVLVGVLGTLTVQQVLRAVSFGFVHSYQNENLKRPATDPEEALRLIIGACASGKDPRFVPEGVNRAAASLGLFSAIEVRRSSEGLAWRIEPKPRELALVRQLQYGCSRFELMLRIRFLDVDGYEVLRSEWPLTKELLSTASALKGNIAYDEAKGVARTDLRTAEVGLVFTGKSLIDWLIPE